MDGPRGVRASHHLQQPPRGVTWEICITLYVRKTNLLMAASIVLLIFCMNKKNVKNKLVEYVYCFVCFIFMLSFPSKFLSMFLYLIFRKINIFAFFSFLVEN